MVPATGQVSRVPNPWLGLLPKNLWGRVKDLFAYTTQILPLAASATQSASVTIESDSDFLATYLTCTVTSLDEATLLSFVPQIVSITDQAAGRLFFSAPTHYVNVYGTAERPAYLSFPRLIKAGSTVSFTHQNLEATSRQVRIAMWGMKVFGFEANT